MAKENKSSVNEDKNLGTTVEDRETRQCVVLAGREAAAQTSETAMQTKEETTMQELTEQEIEEQEIEDDLRCGDCGSSEMGSCFYCQDGF